MSAMKRKRPDTAGDAEQIVLNAIKNRKDVGVWEKELKTELKQLGDAVVVKSIKSLLAKKLIKNFVNVNFKGKKNYMAVEFQPSKDINGGDWYRDGQLDKELVNLVKKFCLKYVEKEKVVTVKGVHDKLSKLTTFGMSIKQAEEILNSMVLDNEVIEVKSSGLPVGATCYRAGPGNAERVGESASFPCRVCPHISLCKPDGVISPSTCIYFAKWLDF